MMSGYLRASGHNVQTKRVRQTLDKVDPAACAERWSTTVKRRRYAVANANSLWHIDGHMKLIKYAYNVKLNHDADKI